ncbi:MAG: pantetheine-phosphate adenylyltransferase [Nitrospirae bacterium]|nr:pantetheine-phosphate adenylyltransferase [Nitrospirota bacterium]
MNPPRSLRAVYPGSFDPITLGHVDIARRGLKIFEELTVAVVRNPRKEGLFTIEERVEMIKEVFKNEPRIQVESFSGLLVEFMRRVGARAIIRGLRAVSDFEYEFQMAVTNRTMEEDVETLFMMANESYSYVSSMMVKEIATLGGSVKKMVPPIVVERLRAKLAPPRRAVRR